MAAFRNVMPILIVAIALLAGPSLRAQLAADQVVTRTLKVHSGPGVLTAADLHERFAKAGIVFQADPLSPAATQNVNAMFLNERTGVLMVRTTLADMEKVDALVGGLAMPPIVQLEAKFIEVPFASSAVPLQSHAKGSTNVTIYTERQSRAALQSLVESSGVNVITAPSVTTISGRQARLRTEEARTLQYDTPPRLPKDTRPDADPTPYNNGRLPYPANFTPS